MKISLTAWLFLAISVAISAAPFENLGFDNPKITPQGTFDYGSTADVLPGWQVYYDNAPQPIIGFNGTHVFPDDLTDIDLISADKNLAFTEGAYSLYVHSQRTGDFFSLVQRGDVPQDAPFLELRKMNRWELSVDGQAVKPILDTQTTEPASTPSVLVFDLSAHAGQNVELRLSSIPSMPFFDAPSQLDSLHFIQDIPEPSIGLLFLLGLPALVIFGQRERLYQRRSVDEQRTEPGANQAAGANVGERRAAACSNRGSVAALPAMAQLFRSAIVPYVMSCGHRIMFTESWAGETVQPAVPFSDPPLAQPAPGLFCHRRGVPQNDSVDMIL